MNEIDDAISKALAQEERELLDRLAAEPSMHAQAFAVMRGRHRVLVGSSIAVMVALVALAAWCAVRFFEAEEVRDLLLFATGFVLAILNVLAIKVWFWMELVKNSVVREVKRLELQVARLGERVPGPR
jgi:hypothetical protein